MYEQKFAHSNSCLYDKNKNEQTLKVGSLFLQYFIRKTKTIYKSGKKKILESGIVRNQFAINTNTLLNFKYTYSTIQKMCAETFLHMVRVI